MACHVGTLLAVVVFFRADVVRLIAAAPGALTGRDGEYERLGRLIIAGTIPIVIVGGLFADVIEARLRSPLVVAITLTIGGIGLIVAERIGRKTREARTLGYGEALAIGVAQAAALAPGISRSGATLTMSLLLDVQRDSAARFVFLMSLPAIVAAAAKEALDLSEVGMAGIAGHADGRRTRGVGDRRLHHGEVFRAVPGVAFARGVRVLPLRARRGDGAVVVVAVRRP